MIGMCNEVIAYVTGPGKRVLSTQSTPANIMATIFYSICAIQNLLVVLNSTWIAVYMLTF